MATIKYPLVLVNFKCYREAVGDNAVKLGLGAQEVSERLGVCVAVAPQFVDIPRLADRLSIPVFGQHVDPIEPGAHTGHILAESLVAAGASGVIINHSERQLTFDNIQASVARAKNSNLVTVVCAGTDDAGERIAQLNPDAIALEPPELIGSGIAVSKARPEIITNGVARIKKKEIDIKVLCGAGITSGDDVRKAVKLGSEGILVASGVVKARDQRKALTELVEAVSTL